jgi:hypothetical protein
MIFNVKMDFRRKARLVAGKHVTNAPELITYASVVSKESVRIAFTLATILGLDIMMTDITNAYIYAPCAEKVAAWAGMESGESHGRLVLIVQALYGLKLARASWRSHMVVT